MSTNKKIFFIGLLAVIFFPVVSRGASLVSLSVTGQFSPNSASSSDQEIAQIMAEMRKRLVAIAVELTRISLGLPPNPKSPAYLGLENLGLKAPAGSNAPSNNTNNSQSSPNSSGQTPNSTGSNPAGTSGSGNNPSQGGLTGGGSNNNGNSSSGGSSGGGGSSSGASGAGANQPFGGLTGQPTRCTCTDDYSLIPITPPKSDLPNYIMYSPSKATTYMFGQVPQAGVQVLGTHGEDVTCRVRVAWYCVSVGSGKDVIMIGTSGTGGAAPSTGPGTVSPQQPAQPPASSTPPTTPPDLCKRMGAKAYSYPARGTGYTKENNAMEGGSKDRIGNELITLQDYLAGRGSYVSVAMDTKTFPYGTQLCIPELEQKYGKQIVFKVVDTGSAFTGQGTSRIDICTANQSAAGDSTINGSLTLVSSVQSNR